MTWLVGIDGGGTQTRAALARADTGEIVGRGCGGPGNAHSGSREMLKTAVETAVDRAFSKAGLELQPIVALAAGLAGAGTEVARREACTLFGSLSWAGDANILCLSDLELAYNAAFGEHAGVLIIAGTGSSCLVGTPEGTRHQIGGWGALLDDDGSAYDLSRRALRAVVRAIDGRGPPTALREEVFAQWSVNGEAEFLPALRERSVPGTLAKLAPHVLATAATGDSVAEEILIETADGLVKIALTALRLCGEPYPSLCLHGGLFGSSAYREAVIRRIHAVFPQVNISLLRADVLEAAVSLALNRWKTQKASAQVASHKTLPSPGP